MTYASVQDVEARLGRPITEAAEVAQVDAWLTDTEIIIRNRIPSLDAMVAAGTPTRDTVVMVESNAVVRMVRNPEGKTQERIDDYSWGLPANPYAGSLYLTEAEWGLLEPGASDGAWTIRPGGPLGVRGTWLHPDVWVPAP